MARGNANINDQLQHTRSRNAAEERSIPSDGLRRKRQIRSWIILVATVVMAIVIIAILSGSRSCAKQPLTLSRLPCYSNQSVKPFRDGLLYYDGGSIHHLSSAGTIRWSFPAGSEAEFYAGPGHVAIWSGTQLYLVDRNGNATYNDMMEGNVQFARVVKGRTYYEADCYYTEGKRRAERIVYSSDGHVWYTEDHYVTFTELFPSEQ